VKGYEKYLPDKKETKTILIQAKIDPELHERAKALLDKEGWTWHEVLTGLLAKLIDESKSKRAG
jgi:antitoxin component of RelBE/YafQ-DinJ toxin-antitoxin module